MEKEISCEVSSRDRRASKLSKSVSFLLVRKKISWRSYRALRISKVTIRRFLRLENLFWLIISQVIISIRG